jgi:copper ion binding protein
MIEVKNMIKEILISGMTCGHCVKRVENALFEVDGVHSVAVSLEDKKATIDADDKIEDQLIKDAIDDIGYTVEAIQ